MWSQVRWSGEHVPGSPFVTMIFDTEEELARFNVTVIFIIVVVVVFIRIFVMIDVLIRKDVLQVPTGRLLSRRAG